MKRMLLLSLVLCGVASAGEWTASVGSDYETFQLTALYSPDPNGGIGITAVTDSYIEDDTEENLAVGLFAQFYIGDIVGDVTDRVIPGSWSLSNAPFKTYGTLAFLLETEEEHDFLFQVGTKTVLFPEWRIRPCITSIYSKGEGGSEFDEDFKTLLGVDYRF
jgi:hypothetical protein